MTTTKCKNCGHAIERVDNKQKGRIESLFRGELVHSNLGSKTKQTYSKKLIRKWAMICRVKLGKHTYCNCTNPEVRK